MVFSAPIVEQNYAWAYKQGHKTALQIGVEPNVSCPYGHHRYRDAWFRGWFFGMCERYRKQVERSPSGMAVGLSAPHTVLSRYREEWGDTSCG